MSFHGQPIRRTWRHWPGVVSGGGGGRLVSGLSFQRPGGPLLAVVGLSGGVGTSALAYLIAATAARESSAPVLVTDTGGPTAGLSNQANVSSRLTLADITERLVASEPVSGVLWAEGEHGLRVLAAAPQFTVEGDPETTLRVLSDARDAHGLTVADAGTLARRSEQAVLKASTHVAWMTLASRDGVTRARRVLERIAPLARPEILVARTDPHAGKPPIQDLAQLAEDRRAPLVLMPSFGETSNTTSDALAEQAQVPLQMIGGVLHR